MQEEKMTIQLPINPRNGKKMFGEKKSDQKINKP